MTVATARLRTGVSLPSLGVALLIELVLLGAAALLLARVATPPARSSLSEPVALALLAEPPQPPVAAPPKPVVPPEHKSVPKTVSKPVPHPTAPKVAPAPTPLEDRPVTTVAQPTAFSQPVPPPVASAPPAPAAPAVAKPDPNIAYAGKVRAAVQAALVYPPAAASLHFGGRVRVAFHLRDGVPSQARVLVSSGIGMIDRAALQSVQNASYPHPDSELQGRDLLYEVWVEFNG